MNAPLEPSHIVRHWVQKAENDLKNAEHTLRMKPADCPYDTVCYHAQQCAEKYIKALLVHLKIEFPKIHDIGELLELLPPPNRSILKISEQENLTDLALTSRYPGDWEPIEPADAAEAVALARKVREAIRKELPSACLP